MFPYILNVLFSPVTDHHSSSLNCIYREKKGKNVQGIASELLTMHQRTDSLTIFLNNFCKVRNISLHEAQFLQVN